MLPSFRGMGRQEAPCTGYLRHDSRSSRSGASFTYRLYSKFLLSQYIIGVTLIVRHARPADIPQIIDIQAQVYPKMAGLR